MVGWQTLLSLDGRLARTYHNNHDKLLDVFPLLGTSEGLGSVTERIQRCVLGECFRRIREIVSYFSSWSAPDVERIQDAAETTDFDETVRDRQPVRVDARPKAEALAGKRNDEREHKRSDRE